MLMSIEYDNETRLVLGGQCGNVGADYSPLGNPYITGDFNLPAGVPDRYAYQVDLTDPDNPAMVESDAAVVSAVRLPGERDAKVALLWSAIDGFIQFKSNGRPRYDHNFKAAANALSAAGLTGDALTKYQAVFAWINAVWAVYHAAKAAIDGAATLADLDAVSWDLSPYEVGAGGPEEDPGVGLSELLI